MARLRRGSEAPPVDADSPAPPDPAPIRSEPSAFGARRPVAPPSVPSGDAAERTLQARLAGLRSGRPDPKRTPCQSPKPPSAPPLPDPIAHRAMPTPPTPKPRHLPDWDPSIAGRLNGLLASVGGGPVAPARPPDQARLMAALPGRERPTPVGRCYVLEDAIGLDARHGDRLLNTVAESDPGHAAILAKENTFELFDPCGALFFDLETTGLSTTMGTLPFLIGAAHLHHEQVLLEQWLLREPDEEAAALHDLADRIAEADWLVSFNGRSFDWPLLAARFALHRIEVDTDHLLGHLDLLLIARRVVKHAVPNCKLTTLEAELLGLRRVDDIPGSKVPATYQDYLRGGATDPLVAVVQHNRDDILSMLTLLGLLLDRVQQATSWALRDPPGALAVAKAALAIGRLAQAEQIFAALADFEATRAAGEKGLKQVERKRRKTAGWETNQR